MGLALELPRAAAVARRRRRPERAVLPPGAHLGQLRVLLDLDAPALVLGEVPVEDVELVQRHQVQVLEQELLGHEVAAHVEVAAAPGEARACPRSPRREPSSPPRRRAPAGTPRAAAAGGRSAARRRRRPAWPPRTSTRCLSPSAGSPRRRARSGQPRDRARARCREPPAVRSDGQRKAGGGRAGPRGNARPPPQRRRAPGYVVAAVRVNEPGWGSGWPGWEPPPARKRRPRQWLVEQTRMKSEPPGSTRAPGCGNASLGFLDAKRCQETCVGILSTPAIP